MRQYEIKIYVKNKRKPIAQAILSSERQLEEFKNELNSPNEFIDFYQIFIKKSEFIYATIKNIEK